MYIPLGRVRSEVDKGRSINGEAKFELSVSNFKNPSNMVLNVNENQTFS